MSDPAPIQDLKLEAAHRFAFGKNWLSFIALIDDDRIKSAEESLLAMLGTSSLRGHRFLDLGSGSGLFSLAASRLGAEVISVDIDPESIEATKALRERWAPTGASWEILPGSALDRHFLGELGAFDVVYSWGTLHHTGDMWSAMADVVELVRPGGSLFISIYNDQGFASRIWTEIKRRYNDGSPTERQALVLAARSYFRLRDEAGWLLALSFHALAVGIYGVRNRPPRPSQAKRVRGMSRSHDLVDWVGGYPFEVAKPEEVFTFVQQRGFSLRKLRTCQGGLGCNEFVFARDAAAPSAPTADPS